jgi:hypothetical protein
VRHAPELLDDFDVPAEAEVPGFAEEMAASGFFAVVGQRQFGWDQPYTGATVAGMLGTHSVHRALPRRRRSALLRDIRSFVETELGGSYVDRYVTTVCVGRLVPE